MIPTTPTTAPLPQFVTASAALAANAAATASASAGAASVAAASRPVPPATPAATAPNAFSFPSPSQTPAAAAAIADFESHARRRVLLGTCGWSDASLLKCGRFYPASVRTPVDRLRHYATHFPCVEVDTSNYAIPSETQVQAWMAATPPTFKFHFKIFGMFTNGNADPRAVPAAVRHMLPAQGSVPGSSTMQLRHTSSEFQDALWSIQNRLLRSVHANGRLGLIIFQFPLSFTPTDANRAHVRWCREQLAGECVMAVEFRCRLWFKDDAEIDRTVRFVRDLGCVLVAVDDLEHEVTGRFIPLPPGQAPRRLPIHLRLAAPHALYVRMHRRQGNQRVLTDSEFAGWAPRFDEARREGDTTGAGAPSVSDAPQPLAGPIYYLIGSDYEDQPIINSVKMQSALEAYDAARREEWQAATAAGGVAIASHPAASNGSPDSSVAAAVPSPEPLLFDYRRYYKAHLARLPASAASDRQTSLGAFFAYAPAQSTNDAPKDERKEGADGSDSIATAAHASSSSAVAVASSSASTSASVASPARTAAARFGAFFSSAEPATFASSDDVVELHERTRIAAAAAAAPAHSAAMPTTPSRTPADSSKRKASGSGAPAPGSSAKKTKRNTGSSSAAAAASAAAATPSVASFFRKA